MSIMEATASINTGSLHALKPRGSVGRRFMGARLRVPAAGRHVCVQHAGQGAG